MADDSNGWTLPELKRRVLAIEDTRRECPHVSEAKDHEVRIRALETWRWKTVGAMAAIQLIATTVIIEVMRKLVAR